MSKGIKIVTLSELTAEDRSGGRITCDCGKPEKAVGGSGKLKHRRLGKISGNRFCIVDKRRKEVVRCYRSKALAKKIVRGFGPGFQVKSG